LQINGEDCGTLDANKMLIETFGRDDIEGKLLILGAPGAGKTTALLSLAEQLVYGAISQPKTIIPVIFELSTWQNDNQSIQSWLIEQLYDLHGGNRKSKLYEQWLERQVLLPLLDGLDELGLERQQKCTEKLNEFAEHYPQLVICCRVKEFEAVDIKLRNLRGAVCLQSLSDLQIQHYLDSLKRSELWEAIQTTPYLQAMLEPTTEGDPGLLRVPLFVKLMADVYDPQQPFFGKSNLLDRYINKQLSLDIREIDRRKDLKKRRWAYQSIQKEIQPDLACKYLHWVAKYLKHQNQIDFLIESIQPNLLEQEQFKYYSLIFILITILITHLINFVNTGQIATSFLGSLILGSIFGAFHLNQRFEPVEYFKFNFNQQALQKGKIGLIAGGITGVIVSIIFASYFVLNTNMVAGLTVGIVLALAIIPIMALTMSIIFGMKQDLKIRSRPNEGILNSFKSMFFSSSLSYLMSIVFNSLYIMQLPLKTAIIESKSSIVLWQLVQVSLTKALGQSLIIALFFGFAFGGGMACIQHVSTRLVMCKDSILPWDIARFLKYCEERKLIHSIGGRYRFLHRELLDHFAQ
jgi:NACHT domain